ncbi:oligosaccharide flippase family protein [Halorubrum laminariae]|uniref:Oligosaccharide flippase family protein n=1 Tax=Halorubrum laminariae TaxID=1433523 RepID=A0ABD6C231_9EURY|nr:oligosaccharide flippase family protein [Halorubrum laminariae]
MSDASEIRLGWETTKALVGKFGQAATGFIGMLIFTRVVGKSDFGGFYLLLTLVMIADRPIRGFGQAVQKRWSEDDAPKEEILGSVLVVNTCAILVAGIGALLARDFLVSYTSLEGSPLLFATLFGSLAFFFPFQQMMGAEGWPAKQTWNDTLRSFLTLPLQVVLVVGGLGALGMGYGLAAATLLVVPVAIYFVRVRPSLPSKETIRSLWKYTRYSTPAAVVGKAYDRIDVLLLGFLIGTTSVANYEVALKLTVPALFISGVLSSALMPKISNTISKGGEFVEDITNSVSYVSILAIPIFFGALAIPKPLVVTAFEPRYAEAAPYLIGLALYQAISTQTAIYSQTLAGMDLPNVEFKIRTITLSFNVIIGVALALTIGPIGIVVATVLAESLKYIVSAGCVVRRVDGIDVVPTPLVMQVISGLTMFFVVKLLQRKMLIQSWLDLGTIIGAGALVYGISLFTISPGVRLTAKSVYRDATS